MCGTYNTKFSLTGPTWTYNEEDEVRQPLLKFLNQHNLMGVRSRGCPFTNCLQSLPYEISKIRKHMKEAHNVENYELYQNETLERICIGLKKARGWKIRIDNENEEKEEEYYFPDVYTCTCHTNLLVNEDTPRMKTIWKMCDYTTLEKRSLLSHWRHKHQLNTHQLSPSFEIVFKGSGRIPVLGEILKHRRIWICDKCKLFASESSGLETWAKHAKMHGIKDNQLSIAKEATAIPLCTLRATEDLKRTSEEGFKATQQRKDSRRNAIAIMDKEAITNGEEISKKRMENIKRMEKQLRRNRIITGKAEELIQKEGEMKRIEPSTKNSENEKNKSRKGKSKARETSIQDKKKDVPIKEKPTASRVENEVQERKLLEDSYEDISIALPDNVLEDELPERQELYEELKKDYSRCIQEENKGITLPKYSKNLQNKLRKRMIKLVDESIIPLLEKATPRSKEQREFLIYTFALAKVKCMVRRLIQDTLDLPSDELTRRRREDPKLIERRNQIVSLRSRACSLEKLGVRIKELLNLKQILLKVQEKEDDQERTRNIQKISNRISQKVEEVIECSSTIDDETKRNIFGGTETESIHNWADGNVSNILNTISWIDSIIIANEKEWGLKLKGIWKDKPAELYYEDPQRAWRYYIEAKISPECTVQDEDMAAFLTAENRSNKKYEDHDNDPIWELTNNLNDADRDIILRACMDIDEYRQAISSRKNMSATGPDGIGVQAYKADTLGWASIIRRTMRVSLQFGKCPKIWKRSRTIMLYKKGDPSVAKNWRPISLTPVDYRMAMVAINWAIQNKARNIISESQKGFIKSQAGALEHIATLNELICDAKRFNKSLYLCCIDFANAFGSVPHKLIRDTLLQRGIPAQITSFMEDLYTGCTTTLEMKGRKIATIPVERGVRQGCPISPTLFDIALEPLLERLKSAHKIDGYIAADETFNAVAYADDLTLIASSEEGMKRQIETVEKFCEYTGMQLAPSKCRLMTYVYHKKRRVDVETDITINNERVPHVQQKDCLEYLGTALSPKAVGRRLHYVEIAENIKKQLRQLEEVNFNFCQKVDMIRRIILPQMDYVMLNEEIPNAILKGIDVAVHHCVEHHKGDRIMFPIEMIHSPWYDGGMNIQCLEERKCVLISRTYMGIAVTQDNKVRKLFKASIQNEKQIRQTPPYDENSENRYYFPTKNGKIISRTPGTQCLVIRAIKAARKINMVLESTDEGVLVVHDLERDECIDCDFRKLVPTMTKVLMKRHTSRMKQLDSCGSTMATLEGDEYGGLLSPNLTKIDDKIVRFALRARADLIPVGANRAKWHMGEQHKMCPYCKDKIDTLYHRLNACPTNSTRMTVRHDLVVEALARSMTEKADHLKRRPTRLEDIRYSRAMRYKDGSAIQDPELAKLKPDMVWYGKNGELYIMEVTTPFGIINARDNTLKASRKRKITKYAPLVEAIREHDKIKVHLLVVIVTSLGAVPEDTIKDLAEIFSETEIKRIARLLVAASLRGSKRLLHGQIPKKITFRPMDNSINDEEGENGINLENDLGEIITEGRSENAIFERIPNDKQITDDDLEDLDEGDREVLLGLLGKSKEEKQINETISIEDKTRDSLETDESIIEERLIDENATNEDTCDDSIIENSTEEGSIVDDYTEDESIEEYHAEDGNVNNISQNDNCAHEEHQKGENIETLPETDDEDDFLEALELKHKDHKDDVLNRLNDLRRKYYSVKHIEKKDTVTRKERSDLYLAKSEYYREKFRSVNTTGRFNAKETKRERETLPETTRWVSNNCRRIMQEAGKWLLNVKITNEPITTQMLPEMTVDGKTSNAERCLPTKERPTTHEEADQKSGTASKQSDGEKRRESSNADRCLQKESKAPKEELARITTTKGIVITGSGTEICEFLEDL